MSERPRNPALLGGMPDEAIGKCGHFASCGRPAAWHVAVPDELLPADGLYSLDGNHCSFLIVCDLREHIEYVERVFPVRLPHPWSEPCLRWATGDPFYEWHDDGCRHTHDGLPELREFVGHAVPAGDDRNLPQGSE